jgi:hypothetical protein
MLTPPRKTFALLLAILCGVSLLPSLLYFGIERILFQPEPYSSALVKLDFYQRLPKIVAKMVFINVKPQPDSFSPFLLLSEDDLTQAITSIMPTEWIRQQVDNILSQFWGYFNFNSDRFTLFIDLKDIKRRLMTTGPASIASQMVNSWQDCTTDQLLLLVSSFSSSGQVIGDPNSIILCKPPQAYLTQLTDVIDLGIQNAVQTIPDSIDLVQIVSTSSNITPEVQTMLDRTFSIYRTARMLLRWNIFFSLGLLILTGVLAAVSWKKVIEYCGFPAMISGLLAFILAVALSMGLSILLNNWIAQLSLNPAALILLPLLQVVLQVLERYLSFTAIIGGSAALLGAAGVIVPRIVEDNV